MFEAVVKGERLSLQPSSGDDRVPGLTVQGLGVEGNIGIFVIPFLGEKVQEGLLRLREGDRVQLTGHSKEGYRPPVIEIDRVDDVV